MSAPIAINAVASSVGRGARARVLARLRSLPAALAGRPVPGVMTARRVWRAVGVEALDIIHGAFLEKSVGGADRAGLRWQSLSPRTIQERVRRANASRGKKRQEMLARKDAIGIDTGALLNSLVPGRKDNVLEVEPGAVRLGSRRSYAGAFHAVRPMWPEAGQWPAEWLRRLAMAAGDVIVQSLMRLVAGGDDGA